MEVFHRRFVGGLEAMFLEVSRCNFTLLFTCFLFKYGFFDRPCTFLMKTLRAVNILMFVVVFCVKKRRKRENKKQKRSLITPYLCFIVYLQYLQYLWGILFESMFSILNEKPYADMTSMLFCVLLGVFCVVFMHPFVVT